MDIDDSDGSEVDEVEEEPEDVLYCFICGTEIYDEEIPNIGEEWLANYRVGEYQFAFLS